MSELDGVKILEELLKQIARHAKSDEELLRLWISIGERMGVSQIMPHVKVILYEDENEERHPVGVIGSPDDLVVDFLTSPSVFSYELCELSLETLKSLKVWH